MDFHRMPFVQTVRRRCRNLPARRWGWGIVSAVALVAAVWWLPPLPAPRFLEHRPTPDVGFTAWKQLAQGIDYASANFTTPRLMCCEVVRLDLANTNLTFVVKPSNGDRPGETDSEFPSSFVRANHLQAAVNTTPFTPVPRRPRKPLDLQGLAVSAGDRYSEAEPNLDSLVITRDNRVRLVRAGGDTRDAWNGAGGFLVTLQGGTNVAENLQVEPATVIGLSGDRRWMFWLVVDGRQPGRSEGSTPRETAEMLRQLGATDAINMDGGGSSTLAIGGGWKGVRLLNRPCHWLVDGMERPVGGLLGVRSRPLR